MKHIGSICCYDVDSARVVSSDIEREGGEVINITGNPAHLYTIFFRARSDDVQKRLSRILDRPKFSCSGE